MPKKNYYYWITGLFLLIAVTGIYFSSLHANFILDDRHMIESNNLLKSPSSIGLFFNGHTTDYQISKGMCRPLLMTTFNLNYFFSGLNPADYRTINIAIHFCNAVLIFLILKIFSGGIPEIVPLSASALFLLHPINSEAIIYISSRSDLLMTFFILSAFAALIRGRHTASLILYVLALLTKEPSIIFIILAASYSALYKPPRLSYKYFLHLALITASYFIYYCLFFIGPSSGGIIHSLASNIFLQSRVAVFYLRLFFFPFNLDIAHEFIPLAGWLHWQNILSLLFLIILTLLAFLKAKKHQLFSIGVSILISGLAIKMFADLRPLPAMEHHFYFPSIGLYFIIVDLIINKKLFLKNFSYILGAILFISAVLTSIRSHEYRDDLIFWQISVKRSPNSSIAHSNLGTEYLKRGLLGNAKDEFQNAVKFDFFGERVYARLGLAYIFKEEKMFDKALSSIYDALLLNKAPQMNTYYLLGDIYWNMGNKEKAIAAWRQELKYYPDNQSSRIRLDQFYSGRNKTSGQKL
jgi:tetratricopeptide (TPR) repeat protein